MNGHYDEISVKDSKGKQAISSRILMETLNAVSLDNRRKHSQASISTILRQKWHVIPICASMLNVGVDLFRISIYG